MKPPTSAFEPAWSAVGAVGIVTHEDTVLLALSHDRGWEPPGGYCDADEYIVDALRREVREETGYLVQPIQLTGVYQCVRDHAILSFVFLCQVQRRVSRDVDESLAVKWCPIAELGTTVTYEPHRLRLDAALTSPSSFSITRYTVNPFSVNDTWRPRV